MPRFSLFSLHFADAARDILREAMPHGKAERRLTLALALWYAALVGLWLTFSDPYTSLMGYDTRYNLLECLDCTHLRNWYVRHPLQCLFYAPFSLLSKLLGGHSFAYICYGLNVVWLTLGTLCLYKLLRGFVEREASASRLTSGAGARCLLPCLLFCSLAYVLLIACQIDSYALNIFLLPLSLLVVVRHRRSATDNIMFLLLSGVTLTNGAKLLLAFFVVEKGWRQALGRAVRAVPLFLVSISWYIPLVIYRIVFKHTGVLATLMNDSAAWSKPLFSLANRAEAFFSNFFAEPILFHFRSLAAVRDRQIMPFYDSFAPYILLAVLAFAILLSLWVNRRHICVRLFAAYFAIDVFVCFVVGFGIDEANIYAPHYLFFVPLLIGLLSIRGNRGGSAYGLSSKRSLILQFLSSFGITPTLSSPHCAITIPSPATPPSYLPCAPRPRCWRIIACRDCSSSAWATARSSSIAKVS